MNLVMKMFEVSWWVKFYKYPILNKFVYNINKIIGIDVPIEIQIGKNINFAHNSIGTVIHPKTKIEDNVLILSNVTIGKADVLVSWEDSGVKGFVIENGAV